MAIDREPRELPLRERIAAGAAEWERRVADNPQKYFRSEPGSEAEAVWRVGWAVRQILNDPETRFATQERAPRKRDGWSAANLVVWDSKKQEHIICYDSQTEGMWGKSTGERENLPLLPMQDLASYLAEEFGGEVIAADEEQAEPLRVQVGKNTTLRFVSDGYGKEERYQVAVEVVPDVEDEVLMKGLEQYRDEVVDPERLIKAIHSLDPDYIAELFLGMDFEDRMKIGKVGLKWDERNAYEFTRMSTPLHINPEMTELMGLGGAEISGWFMKGELRKAIEGENKLYENIQRRIKDRVVRDAGNLGYIQDQEFAEEIGKNIAYRDPEGKFWLTSNDDEDGILIVFEGEFQRECAVIDYQERKRALEKAEAALIGAQINYDIIVDLFISQGWQRPRQDEG